MVRAYLHAAFAAAAKSDHDPRRAAHGRSAFRLQSNPVSVVPRQADFDRARDRVLSDEELKAYCIALRGRNDPVAAVLKVSLLLGGQRIVQLLRARWQDYDRDASTLTLHDAKGRGGTRKHVLPVSARVAATIPSPHPDGGDFIFSSGHKLPIHPSTVAVAVNVIAKSIYKTGPKFAAGDARRSVETRMAAMGISKDHRAQVLSHGLVRGVQERHYDRHDYLPEKAAALALWERHLDALTTPPDPGSQVDRTTTARSRPHLRLVA